MGIGKLTNSLWKLQVIGWLIYFLLMFLTFLTRETDETISYIFMIKSFRTLVGFSLSCVLWLIYREIVNRQAMGVTVAVILIASALFGSIWTALETLLFWSTLPNFDLASSLQYKPRVALTYTVTLLAWSAIYFCIRYWKQVQIEHQNALHAKMLAETAQLEMLRYQVNPHFLFNALNSIRASVSPNNKAAKQMITQLSEFLRHSLLSNDKKENTLSEELEAIENYLAIEKIRFEDALDIEFDIEENAKHIMIPCFLLNPLVENAIKHGFRSTRETLKIKITATLEDNTKLLIEVKNTGKLNYSLNEQFDGQANDELHDSATKIGLNNVQERLEKQLAGKSSFALFEEDGCVIARIEISK